MPTPNDRFSSATSSPLSGRRLLSRFITPKSRSVTDFHIQVDDPHKQYSPGDRVTGSVHLSLAKPIRLTHLVVCLHGFVQVYKNPGVPPSDGYRANNAHIGSGRGSRPGEYFGNGFASLFEDEVVLSGDGRLGERNYVFRFILEFPDAELPSSISFERGTISYVVTATLTRPTAISPTMHCDHKVYLVDRIDISQFLPPRPRTITLEPISRRSKAKNQARRLVESHKGDAGPQSRERPASQTSSSPSLQIVADDGLPSPALSDMSSDSLITSQGQSSQRDSIATSSRPSDACKSSRPRRSITATVEALTGGCLRGDSIPIRVQLTHTKHVKSLHGIIITLYRQARVDMHPTIPLGPTEKGKEKRYEDYYPRSMTGLGGLSLSGAGSSHVFRKDLSQTTVPLIVDPHTLTAESTGRVHIPDDAFPTISTVPGDMVSFRYYVEVILDVQGKLSSQDRNLGNLGGLASTIHQGLGAENMDRDRSAHTFFIDTASVRRDKGVVACTFEVVVGTRDSQRKKGKQKAEIVIEPQPDARLRPQQCTDTTNEEGPDGHDWFGYDQQYYHDGSLVQHGHSAQHGYYDHTYYDPSSEQTQYAQLPPVPPPPMEDETLLSEKERMRRAEARLLPSQPPTEDENPVESANVATAPYLPDENGYSLDTLLTPASDNAGPSRNDELVPIDFARAVPLPSSPAYERRAADVIPRTPDYEPSESTTLSPSSSNVRMPTDDKKELQRRYLETEASAPPEEDGIAGAATEPPAPTAPFLADGENGPYPDGLDSHADAEAAGLPRYER